METDEKGVTHLPGLARINARGEMTGEADLYAWCEHDGVYLKLGRQRVYLNDLEWAALVRGVEGGNRPGWRPPIPMDRDGAPDPITRIASLFAWLCEQIPGEFLDNAGVPGYRAGGRLHDRIEGWIRDGNK